MHFAYFSEGVRKRFKTSIWVMILIASLMTVTCGCDNNTTVEERQILNEESFETIEIKPMQPKDSVHIEELDVQVDQCIAGNAGYAYYTEHTMMPQLASAEYVKIYVYSYETGETDVVYQWDGDGKGFWLNELKATEENLYWVVTNIEGTVLQRFSLEDGTIHNLYSHKEGLPLVLSVSENGIFWYDYYEKEDEISLKYYAESEDRLYCMEENFVNNSIYDRVSIADGLLTYVVECDDHKEIVRYDLDSETVIDTVPFEKDVVFDYIYGNQNYAVWLDNPIGAPNGIEGRLCAYDYEKRTLKRITLPKELEDIFSINLMEENVLVNISGKGIYIYDLVKDQLIEPKYDRYSNVLIPTLIQDQYFLAENMAEDYQSSKLIKIQNEEGEKS